MTDRRRDVVLLPGVVTPAELAYGNLISHMAGEARCVAKDLALYRGASPPADYGIGMEIDDALAVADEAGMSRFHLVGFSGGGTIALAIASHHPERVESLALIEPAWIGSWDMTPAELDLQAEIRRLLDPGMAEEEVMAGFVRWHLAEGVEPPAPPRPRPEWMATRPAGMRALTRAFREWDFGPDVLRRYQGPVYFVLGALSNGDIWEPMIDRLSHIYADFGVERWDGCHHFAPPHRTQPERFAHALSAFHGRSEDLTPSG